MVFFSAVATADDYAAVQMYTFAPTAKEHWPLMTTSWPLACWGEVQLPAESPTRQQLECWDWCSANYSPERTGTGSTAVLGPPDVVEVLEDIRLPYFRLLAHTNRGGKQWAVTAVGLLMTALPESLLRWMHSAGWFHLELPSWPRLLKQGLNSIRRTCAIHPDFPVSRNDVLLLRKLPNCASRNKVEADWEEERLRRTVNTPAHFFPMPDGSLSRTEWLRRLRNKLRYLTNTSVDSIMSTARLDTWEDWWKARARWAPKGSSNSHKNAEDYLRDQGMRIPNAARAGKRTMMALIGERRPVDFLSWFPYRQPRRSTKNEPGDKNRALYAIDDNSFTIASFPSVAVEKYINFDGIYAQQSPSDVANWVKNHIVALVKNLFALSIDYRDFNSDHEMLALTELDMAWASSWTARANQDDTAKVKSACAVWTAVSHLNAWVDFGDDRDTERILGGLFSGDRNTARDNSMLHAAYSKLMHDAAQGMIGNFELINPAYTGDDEDAQFSCWTHALYYLTCHYAAGFAITAHKQLAGNTSHEYLQRVMTDDIMPRRPICAALAQLCSGNWYQTNYVWFDGIITSVNDNLWELHTRGMPLMVARTLAKRVLNRAMKVRTDQGYEKLEWFAYRSGGAYSPLWGVTTERPPAVELGSSAVPTAPKALGIEAWTDRAKHRFGSLLTDAKLKVYARDLQKDNIGEMFAYERNAAMHKDARVGWPRRMDADPDVGGGTYYQLDDRQLAAVSTLLLGGVVERHPRTEAELVSRFGLDTQLYAMIGGKLGLLRSLRPKDVAQWEEIVTLAPTPNGWHQLDPALRSWASAFRHVWQGAVCTTGHTVRLQRSTLPQAPLTIVYATNGSGKTTATRLRSKAKIIDMDDIVRMADCMSAIKNTTRRQLPASAFPNMVERLARVLSQYECNVLTTQYPWEFTQQICAASGRTIGNVLVMQADRGVLEQRLVESRFWTPEKVQRRIDRFTGTVADIPTAITEITSWDDVAIINNP